MKFNIFKSLFVSKEEKLKKEQEENEKKIILKKIDDQTNHLIETENYDALIEFSQNGYQLNYNQAKRLTLSFLSFPEGKMKYNDSFNTNKWLNFLDKLKQTDTSSFNMIFSYMLRLFSHKKEICNMWPFPERYDILKHSEWEFPNTLFELKVAHSFLTHFKEDALKWYQVDKFNGIKNNIMGLVLDKNEGSPDDAQKYLEELSLEVSNIIDYKMNFSYKDTLEDVKKIFHTNENKNTDTNNVLTTTLPEKTYPPELREKIESIYQLINSIDKMSLVEEQRLEFNNLINEKLPKMLNTYLDINVDLREVLVGEETVNAIFSNNLDNFKQIIDKIKESQTQLQVTEKLNDLKVHGQYLKSKM
jgi:hypothetical protein